jgi:hypothetical protein
LRTVIRVVAALGLCDLPACLDSDKADVSPQESQADQALQGAETSATGDEGSPDSSALMGLKDQVQGWTARQQRMLVWRNNRIIAAQKFGQGPPTETPDPTFLDEVQTGINALSAADKTALLLWTADRANEQDPRAPRP